MKVLVLDTSALIMGLDPSGLEFESYSVPEVSDELRQQTSSHYRLTISVSSGKLQIRTPTLTSRDEVLERAKKLGDRISLSPTDISVLALTLDLHKEGKSPVLVSDDYAVQNVAEGIGLSHQSLATLGIRQKYDWVRYCPACFRRYSGEEEVCEICGTKLKRRPLRKVAVKKQRMV